MYGTERADAYRLMEDSLNLRETRITDREYVDGKERYVLNRQETMLAGQKQEAIKEAFSEWIFQNPERRENIADSTMNFLILCVHGNMMEATLHFPVCHQRSR